MKNHPVHVRIAEDKLKLGKSEYSIAVGKGDTITWTLDCGGAAHFAVLLPSFHSPLTWCCKAKKGKVIKGKVRKSALPGVYPYGLCVFDGARLRVLDPDIIVTPPKGGR